MKLLNIGCGQVYHPDWINLDLYRSKFVKYHNIKKTLPFEDNSIDAIYHSHVLEHLTQEEGAKFLEDCYRVFKKGGVMRAVVPDLETICREYIKNLENGYNENEKEAIKHYQWNKMEMFDQIIRQKPGGKMVEAIRGGTADINYVVKRNGEEWISLFKKEDSEFKKAARKLYYFLFNKNPQNCGEAHKWMYDKLDLKLVLESSGFKNFTLRKYNQSKIPNWESYQLDTSKNSGLPRKPDSLYAEAEKDI